MDPARVDLPGIAELRIDQRLAAETIGRLLGDRFEPLRLRRLEWEHDGTDALDLQPQRVHIDGAGRIEVARSLDACQACGERGGKVAH